MLFDVVRQFMAFTPVVMQPWMLWILLWTAESYAPSDRARGALSLDTSSGKRLANDFVNMLTAMKSV